MMQLFNTKTALTAMAAFQSVLAHSGFSNFYVDGVDQGDAICVRMNPNVAQWTFPVEDLSSPDMACGFGGTTGVPRVCEVGDGSTLTFEWRDNPDDASKGVIDPSHMGPCAVYMKKVESAITDPAHGDGWFKLWDQGYDESSSKKWCTLNLIESKGLMTVSLPKGLQGGSYLIRPELLALHKADHGDPQYYTGCAQVFLKSSGSLVPSDTVSIPGYVSNSDPADSFNIWAEPMKLPYPIPGPGVANYTTGASVVGASKRSVDGVEGQKPADCILESGSNFCGKEVPNYSDETGCWAAGKNCWTQNDACWTSAPATGGNCKIWQAKCQDLNDRCNAKNFVGPPSKGKDLTPAKRIISPPAPLGATTGGDVVVSAAAVSGTDGSSSAAPGPASPSSAAPIPASSSSAAFVQAASSSSSSIVHSTLSSGPAPYGNYTQPTSVAELTSKSSVAPQIFTSTASTTISIVSYGKEAAVLQTSTSPINEMLSTPVAAADGQCTKQATVTVTSKDTIIVTMTVYPSSAMDVESATGSSESDKGADNSSTPVAAVLTSSVDAITSIKSSDSFSQRQTSTSRNYTSVRYSSGYAAPSGFTRLPKSY